MKFSLTKFAILLAGTLALTTSDFAVSAATSDQRMKQFVLGSSQSRTVETGENETAEIILVDGTSVVIAPGSLVTVITSKDQPIAIRVERGTLRVTGGLLNRTQNISIMTPHALLSLKSGSAFIQVGPESTRTHLLNGKEILVSSGGRSQTIYRTGFQIVASNGRTTAPRRMSTQDIVNDLNSLSRGLQTGTLPRLGSTRVGSSALPSEQLTEDISVADENVQIAEAVEEISRLDNAVGFDSSPNDLGSSGSESNGQGSSGSSPSSEPIDFSFDLAGGGFSPSLGETSTPITENQTTTSEANTRIRQDHLSLPVRRYAGPITNRIFPTNTLSLAVDDLEPLTALTAGGDPEGVVYYYGFASFDEGADGLTDRSNNFGRNGGLVRFPRFSEGLLRSGSFHFVGPLFTNIPTIENLVRADTTFGTATRQPISDEGIIWHSSKGVGLLGFNYGTDFLDGAQEPRTERPQGDNFIFLDMEVLASYNWAATSCGANCSSRFQSERDRLLGELGQSEVYEERYYETTVGSETGATGAFLIRDPDETRRFIFAAGDLDGVIQNPVPGTSLDRFHLSAGMAGPITNGLSDLNPGMFLGGDDRAFFRGETWSELDDDFLASSLSLDTSQLTQSDLYIINPSGNIINLDGSTTPETSKLLYADFGLANSSDGRQVSTISATIGEVRYRFRDDLFAGQGFENEQMVDAIITAQAVGSSRGLTSSGASESPVLLSSFYSSSATGGGNPNISTGSEPTPGRLGFFVLENAGEIYDDVEGTDQVLAGGVESPLGENRPSVQYAALRLGVATGTDALPSNRTGFGVALNDTIGYAVGLVDVETPGGSTIRPMGNPDLLPDTFSAPNLRFSNFDAASNSFQVSIDDLTLGGEGGASAYVSDTEFGARSTDDASDAALISGGLVAEGIGDSFSSTTDGYEHVKWGFFFGDIDTGLGSESREHAHMGTFAAGNRLTTTETGLINESVRQAMENGLPTTVQYSGHAIGNVVMGGIVSTQTGTFSDTFDFGSRTGRAELSIGGATVAGNSSLVGGGFDNYTSSVTGSGGISGELNGSFIGGAVEKTTVGGGSLTVPGGLVGGFALSDGESGGFRAVGSFAGE